MAPNAVTKFATLSLLVLLALATSSAATKYQNQELIETNIVFYMHEWGKGPKISTVPVAGIPNTMWSLIGFGTIAAVDDKLTMAIEENSSEIGRARGIYVNSALDGSDAHILTSLVFTNKEFNGSTLQIQGADKFFEKYREVSVVSGTGKFRLAKGYATLETEFLNAADVNAIIKWNVTVFHYCKIE